MSEPGRDPPREAPSPPQRVDKWLFFARIAKSRSLAQRMVADGRVRCNGDKLAAASASVRAGDVLTIALDRRVLVLKVAAPGKRRGPAPEARELYEDMSPPPPPREARAPAPEHRPGGRDREAIRRLKRGQ